MAKRKSSDGEGLNLDSLMDALTNVVAVLILVLLLVNADATNTIIKYFTDLEPATPEEVQQSQEKVDKLIEQKKQAELIFQQEPPKPEEIQAAKQRISALALDIKIQQKDIKKMSDLQKELEVAETNRDKEREIVTAMQLEIEKIKSQLDTTEIEPQKDNVLQDIQIPEMKNIPENANVYYVYVQGKKLSLIDQKPIIEEIEKAWIANKKDLFLERIKPDKKYVDVYDQIKSQDFLTSLMSKLKSNLFGLQILPHMPVWVDTVALIFKPGANNGMDIAELEKPQNIFLEALRKISADRNAVLFFRVQENGEAFLAYQKAREYVESKSRLPIGFGLILPRQGDNPSTDIVPITLDTEVFRVKPTGERPKQDPNRPKPTPDPTMPKRVKDKLG